MNHNMNIDTNYLRIIDEPYDIEKHGDYRSEFVKTHFQSKKYEIIEKNNRISTFFNFIINLKNKIA